MSKPVLTRNRRYRQGQYRPLNPGKYIGNPCNIIYRSGWEKIFLQWCDITPSVLAYGSEELVIPYISPLDGKQHRYFIDFFIVVKQSDGAVKKFAVEIKPLAQTKPPKIGKKTINESLKRAIDTYTVNQAKWEAARAHCRRTGTEFIVLTEKELIKGKDKRKR